MQTRIYIILSLALLTISCGRTEEPAQPPPAQPAAPQPTAMIKAPEKDAHSYSNPEHLRVRHVDLSLDILFDQKIIKGTAVLSVERTSSDHTQPLVLDTRGLQIEKTELSTDGATYASAAFKLGTTDPILGTPLTIAVPENIRNVRVTYSTGPEASALQWLAPEQTAGKQHPFLFTQSQAIHARSWIPLQDSPGVRVSYKAWVRTPRELVAVMSATNDWKGPRDGDYQFEMTQPIPSYLIALAVGDISFRPLSNRTGAYAEPPVLARAASEFADTEKMMKAAEALYGPYRWERYDVLVLPPSFPFGGMENPRLTFATPTILAGDKSLVSLVAHELAHSWSGNLVTNATWRDFWLNEGFTVYLERRILEQLYGRPRAEMEAVLGRQDLEKEIAQLDDKDEILHVDLKGRDPDDGFHDVPYEKGALFLRHLEETFGRQRFDGFLKQYFDHFAFQSITTAQFVEYLKQHLLGSDAQLAARVPITEWIEMPGIPAGAPKPVSEKFALVEQQADQWLQGKIKLAAVRTRGWSTHEWLHFLRHLPAELEPAKMQQLDQAFKLTRSGNSEITFQWLRMAVHNRYEPAYPRLEEFLTSMGRRKFLKPLYEELVKTPEGRERALAIYAKARAGYHPIAATTVDAILK